jgi:hypothetical protein
MESGAHTFAWRMIGRGLTFRRILLHGKKFSVDLSDKGNATEGTPIQLWSRWHGANQIWALIERNW